MMKVVAVIPARWASKRFEGKVLADLCGKPMLQWVWERVNKADKVDEVIIACDDKRIYQACESFGAKPVVTSEEHVSGSDRIAEAIEGIDADIVINIQGDEPLIRSELIDDLAYALMNDDLCNMATAIKSIKTEKELNDPNVVKVVIDAHDYALYFSRSVIPYNRDKGPLGTEAYWKHLGIYAYRKDFLLHYSRWPKSFLEGVEKLEQLRVLEAGQKIKTVETQYESYGVDTLEDLSRVAEIIKREMYND